MSVPGEPSAEEGAAGCNYTFTIVVSQINNTLFLGLSENEVPRNTLWT